MIVESSAGSYMFSKVDAAGAIVPKHMGHRQRSIIASSAGPDAAFGKIFSATLQVLDAALTFK
jgi:hypothetical protein